MSVIRTGYDVGNPYTHCAFMTLPLYTRMREGEVPHLGRGLKPCQGGPWREEMPSRDDTTDASHAAAQTKQGRSGTALVEHRHWEESDDFGSKTHRDWPRRQRQSHHQDR